MKKLLGITLGIVTSVGGFLDVGSMLTSAQAGALFGYQLLWAVAISGILVIFLMEMSGRFAAVSKHTIADAIRERFGFNFFIIPLIALTLVNVLLLAAEIGGMCIALEMATGIAFRWWAIPAGLFVWMFLWKGNFDLVENGGSLLGLLTICFLVAVYVVHPSWHDISHSLIPTAPKHDNARYWFLAISILGASVSPYMFVFYSSGVIEEKWGEKDLSTNTVTSVLGMGLGTTLALAVLVVCAYVFQTKGIQMNHYSQFAMTLTPMFGSWGFKLLVASLFVACFAATLEVSLELSYFICQGLGWDWGENKRPKDAPRFSVLYSLALLLGALIILIGIDPLKLTLFTTAMISAVLPLAAFPFLILMNDKNYVGEHTNGRFTNTIVVIVILLACVLSVITIPLEILGGG